MRTANHPERKAEAWRMLRFLLVGGFGAASYVLFSTLVTWAGVAPWIASACVYAAHVPVLYLLQRRIVFRATDSHAAAFPKYLAIQAVALSLAALLPWLAARAGLPPTLSFIGVVVLSTGVSYLLQSRWAFTPAHKSGA